MTSMQRRSAIAKDTISRSKAMIRDHATEGASLDAAFLSLDQLPALPGSSSPHFQNPEIRMMNLDSFVAARKVMQQDVDALGNMAVLNFANDESPAGGWTDILTKTQEEALCYSSTVYVTLKPEYYPWPNTGPGSHAGIFSPGVVIFKDDLDHDCADLPPDDRRVVSVITVSAPCRCPLTEDQTTFKDPSVLEDLRRKIRLVYRIAGHHGKRYLVLGAFGCGVYRCPPALVAKEMKAILEEKEFRGRFRQIIFAIRSRSEAGQLNFDIFRKTFEGTSETNHLGDQVRQRQQEALRRERKW